MAEVLEGFFRSPRSIEWANGPTKCKSVPPPVSIRLRPCWTAFLSILMDYYPVVPHVRTIEGLTCQHRKFAAVSLLQEVQP
jgi:hypothetical protein